MKISFLENFSIRICTVWTKLHYHTLAVRLRHSQNRHVHVLTSPLTAFPSPLTHPSMHAVLYKDTVLWAFREAFARMVFQCHGKITLIALFASHTIELRPMSKLLYCTQLTITTHRWHNEAFLPHRKQLSIKPIVTHPHPRSVTACFLRDMTPRIRTDTVMTFNAIVLHIQEEIKISSFSSHRNVLVDLKLGHIMRHEHTRKFCGGLKRWWQKRH